MDYIVLSAGRVNLALHSLDIETHDLMEIVVTPERIRLTHLTRNQNGHHLLDNEEHLATTITYIPIADVE